MEAHLNTFRTLEDLCEEYFQKFSNKTNVLLYNAPEIGLLLTPEEQSNFEHYQLREQSVGTIGELFDLCKEFVGKFPPSLSHNMTSYVKGEKICELCDKYFQQFPNDSNVCIQKVPELKVLLTPEELKEFEQYQLWEQSKGTVSEIHDLAAEYMGKFPHPLSRTMKAYIEYQEELESVLFNFETNPECEEKRAYDEYLRRSDELIEICPPGESGNRDKLNKYITAHNQLDKEFSGKFPEILFIYTHG